MARVALLSNPRSTGNRSLLPRIRAFCAEHRDVFHYEVESVEQIGDALRTIARVRPKILVINGGDGTVQATLTELYHGEHFGVTPPPVAVLPNGKTNLIALDLGAVGDPLSALQRIIDIARDDMAPHIVARELIALSNGDANERPVLGMFLGGAGLADSMLYCRNKIYPLGLPNGISHALTAVALLFTMVFGIRAAFLPPKPRTVSVSVLRHGVLTGTFAVMIVTTLHKLVLGWKQAHSDKAGALQLMMVEQKTGSLLGATLASLFGRLGQSRMNGVHIERGDEIRIEGERSSVILDGELFEAKAGFPIVLTPTAPVPFLSLAA
ncbi:diacylglycerol/lipid kinase family protein [Sphingomonas abietis]|uniref:Diacylglycerol kinase family protein n=1 Tax=Sphingomonas abietis TaxID=3012344 RepID=A0ABY7NN51_9SPHN|nr:diacylglycerol kinase family protein [Sphingomonas abietis]WBO22012.1 diacylglycerol kinase family protein [Sphingomonas abietis]